MTGIADDMKSKETPWADRRSPPTDSGSNWRTAWIVPTATVIACLAGWEAAVHLFQVRVYLLPPPSAIAVIMVVEFELFLSEGISTVIAITTGFLLAVAFAVPVATCMVYWSVFRRAVQAILITAQVLPKVALAPLFIVWFGFGMLPKVLMTFLICFFPIVIDTVIGLNSVRPESLMLIRSMGGNRWQSFWKIRLPSALPSMFGGLKVAVTFAVVGTLVAEFVGSDTGLGYVLMLARGNLDTLTVFASLMWLVVIGFVFYYSVELTERMVLRNRGEHRVRELGAGL
jgi:NitT/TauT family transport system permease protein